MNFNTSSEQDMLRDSVERFLSDTYSFEQRQKRIANHRGHDKELWGELTSGLGLVAAALPEDVGGLGGDAVDTMVIMEALGAALVVEPFLETAVMGSALLSRINSDLARNLLHGIVAGEVRTAVAINEASAAHAPSDISTQAKRVGEDWELTGSKPVVWGAPFATHLLVVARTSGKQTDRDGLALFVVPTDHAGIIRHDYTLIDDRPAADLTFNNLRLPSSALLIEGKDTIVLLEEVLDRATAAYCADALGGMRRLLDMTIDYTKQRKQFGKPLASFQVLQHRMVDMYIALEQAVSAVHLATLNLDADPVKRARAVSAAKVAVGQSARAIGQGAVQLHGAMGMTDELAVGHYFKRMTVFEYAFGSVAHHLKRYGDLDTEPAI